MIAMSPPPARDGASHTRTLIVGAGFAGLAMAIRLRAAGDEDWRLVERAPTLGGTWRDNRYPGSSCDVQSVLYSYSFAPEPGWTRTYSPAEEIQDYLHRVARERGVAHRVQTDTALESAVWDETTRVWRVRTSRGELTADVLVTATGALADPKWPSIDGLTDFAGRVVHTSGWTSAVDITGQRVAVIGTGASAVQVVPAIADEVAHLDVYQRSAPWVLPRGDAPVPLWVRRAFARAPQLQRAARAVTRAGRELLVPLFAGSRWVGRAAQARATSYRHSVLAGDVLASSAPDYQIGCKRILISDDYYPTLMRADVDLVADPIVRVTTTGLVVRDATGAQVERPADTIVVATGFLPSRMPIGDLIVGRGGQSLREVWSTGGLQAYKGMAVTGFPNLFMLVGPNSGLGHTSMILMIEAQVAYVAAALATMRSEGYAQVEVRADAQARWNAGLQRRLRTMVWQTGGCSSWYLDEHGRNVTLWPGTTWAFERAVRRFDVEAYDCSP